MNDSLKAKFPALFGHVERIRAGVSGLFGDTLRPTWRFPLQAELRLDGRPIDPQALAEVLAERGAGRDIVFFVHGLMLDDSCWSFERFNMTRAFVEGFDVVPVHVRYDTGRHVSDNGRDLADLWERLHTVSAPTGSRWHVVCHSMGGLVTRSAIAQGSVAGMGFVGSLDKVFFIGTPHRGAPLEKGVRMVEVILEALAVLPVWHTGPILKRLLARSSALEPVGELSDLAVRRLPLWTLEGLSKLFDLRSDGIRDLRHGYVFEEQWRAPEVTRGLRPRRVPIPLPDSIRCYAIAGVLSSDGPETPSPFHGDGMVSTASAANLGEDDELRFLERGRYRQLAGVNHYVMTSRPLIFEMLSRWFAEP